ncbi:MAG: archaetidylserine decarboxylase [Pirellulales bacterium]
MDNIVYFDRYQQKTCVEKVYGDEYLRWTYGTIAGRLALAAIVKRAWFSRWYGWRMDRPGSREKIAPFIEQYELDVREFQRQPDEFANFNEFFYRKLRPESRPVDADPLAVVFPADGRHLCVPDLSRCDGLLVKGAMFSLDTLLADATLAREFADGSMLVSRLCPVDYHRFHFPLSGRAGSARLLNGPLYSVNPIALAENIHILATNKRTLTLFETEQVGKVLLLEIGATCVGGICQTFSEDSQVSKGGEKGYFRFGGSSTILIFPRGRVQFDDDLLANSTQKRELYARVGDRLGTLVSP